MKKRTATSRTAQDRGASMLEVCLLLLMVAFIACSSLPVLAEALSFNLIRSGVCLETHGGGTNDFICE